MTVLNTPNTGFAARIAKALRTGQQHRREDGPPLTELEARLLGNAYVEGLNTRGDIEEDQGPPGGAEPKAPPLRPIHSFKAGPLEVVTF